MTTDCLSEIRELRKINQARRDFWKQALETITHRALPFVAYDLMAKTCVTIVARHSTNTWRMDDGGLIDERDFTTAPPPAAYREFLEAKRALDEHGPRNQDDRGEHENAPDRDVQ